MNTIFVDRKEMEERAKKSILRNMISDDSIYQSLPTAEAKSEYLRKNYPGMLSPKSSGGRKSGMPYHSRIGITQNIKEKQTDHENGKEL